MSQTYKHLSKLTKAELIQIIKDSDYTINVLTKKQELNHGNNRQHHRLGHTPLEIDSNRLHHRTANSWTN